MFRKNAFSTILAISALLAVTFAILIISKPANAGPSKVEVCHIPPDDPGNFHTITVSENALPAHIAHYDLGGACDGECEALCDDGDMCTYEDTGDCESTGCPVPQPIVCGPGQACDPELGCISIEQECPCFTAEDLAGQGSIALCENPFTGFPGMAGLIFEDGSLACSGPNCASIGGLSCGLSPDFETVDPISTTENTACQTLINDFCGLGPLPVTAERSATVQSSQQSFLDQFK